MIYILILITLLSLYLTYKQARENKETNRLFRKATEDLQKECEEKDKLIRESTELYSTLKEKYDRIVSKKKSEEVRMGAIAETLTPFLKGFPYNPKNLKALGNPIDYVSFENDQITFIEVKSGNSKLTKKQKDIKKLVGSGKVKFEVHRIRSGELKIE